MRLSPLFTLSLLLTTWQTAFAVTTDDCSKIKTDAERLACFDNISKQNKTAASAKSKGAKQKSKWHFSTSQDKWDDSVGYTINLISDNQVRVNYGEYSSGAIVISCWKPRMSVYFYTGGFLGGHDNRGNVLYRLDKEQAIERQMDLRVSNRSLGFWLREQSIPFIKEMFGHDKMLVGIQDSGGNPLTMRFSLKGLEEAIKPIRQACNW